MCGIAGVVRYDRPGSESLPDLTTMLRHLHHRGPDGRGTYSGSFAALGNTRLALLDQAGGHQPMCSPDQRYWITYNGEIYNLPGLRRALANQWVFHSRSDTEVVLAAYAAWGADALPRLNGMFAFFIWDAVLETGFGARDRLGTKPFAYGFHNGVFTFASEIKALLAIQSSRTVANAEAVLEYLVAPYFSGVEHPMVRGLEYLQPGHSIQIHRHGIKTSPWWDYDLTAPLNDDGSQLVPLLNQRLRTAVERTMGSDHPIGTFLSGGLDSTLITALASGHMPGPIKSYTVQFTGQASFPSSLVVRTDDTPHALQAARDLGVEHHLVHVSRDTLPDDLRLLATVNDALPAWEQELSQHHLATAASRHHKAVLVGDAADETHYGYSFLLDPHASRTPSNLLTRFGIPPINRALESDPVSYYNSKFQQIAESAGLCWESPVDRLLASTYLIVKRWLPRLLHNGDIHAMSCSLEARVPFGDSELLELARSVHPNLAISATQEKRLLRSAARGLLPEVNRLRPKSALPKDQGSGAVYQTEGLTALNESREFLAAWLDLDVIRGLCDPARTLCEHERSLLFRVIGLHHWRCAYNIETP